MTTPQTARNCEAFVSEPASWVSGALMIGTPLRVTVFRAPSFLLFSFKFKNLVCIFNEMMLLNNDRSRTYTLDARVQTSMKLISTLLLFTSSLTAVGQLYSCYATEGFTKSTGGPVWGRTEIFLSSDSCFTLVQKRFYYEKSLKKRILVDSSVSVGKWNLHGDILKLDFNPDSAYARKEFDTYLVRRKGLKRTTLKEIGVTTNYKAAGQRLK